LGETHTIDVPYADVGLLSGSIRNEDHLCITREMRKKCKTFIALGTCATHGGIPALINTCSNSELFDCYFSAKGTDTCEQVPGEGVPRLLDRCYALDEHIDVDMYLPGCPPHPDHIRTVFHQLINNEKPELPYKSVCDTCPAIRKGKGDVQQIKRCVTKPDFNPGDPIDDMRCLLEQGYLCSGPVTRAGCSGSNGDAPRCIIAGVPCRGCYGPVRQEGNQLVDMLNALASNGIDIKSLGNRDAMLRFSGAHDRLVCRNGGR